MNTLGISPEFTLDGIHKVRENNYNIIKDMPPQEKRDYYNVRGMEIHKMIQAQKAQRT